MHKPGAVLFLLFLAVSAYAANETIVARIECPSETRAKVKWADRIGGDPSFGRETPPDDWITFTFQSMSRNTQNTQTIMCKYELVTPNGTRYQYYDYTVKRKIRDCKHVSARVMDCTLEQ